MARENNSLQRDMDKSSEIREVLPQTDSIMQAYRGWDAFEKGNGIDIIDFDLVPPIEPQRFETRREVLEALLSLRDNIEPNNPQEEFIKAKLNASTYFLRALMGENIPYEEYVENITGVKPELIPEDEIQKQKTVMEDLMRDAGYGQGREPFQDFISRIKVTKAEAETEAKKCEETLIPVALKSLALNDVEFPHEIRFVEERDYWMGWTSTTPEGLLLLRYNFDPIHNWVQGDMEFMTLHEVGGHFVQAGLLRKRIADGEVNPVIGITTVQEPHTFVGEGTADALSYFLPEVNEKLSTLGLLAREQRATRDYLQNNAHIWINQGRNPEELVEYIMSNHPFSNEERIRVNLDNWSKNPSRRAYQYVYGASLYWHRQLKDKLSVEKGKEYLRHAMSGYETPKQIMRFANQLVISK